MNYILYLISFIIGGITASNATFPINGNGTKTNPYQIFTTSHLVLMNMLPLDSFFVLRSNLNFTNINFMPIGNLTNPFTGDFEGNNFTISNFKFNFRFATTTLYENVGLFGVISGANIRNLIINVKIDNKNTQGQQIFISNVGALAGKCSGRLVNSSIIRTNITNVFINSQVDTKNDYYNGVFGTVEDTNIMNSVFNVSSTISFGSDSVNSVTDYTRNCKIENVHVFTKLSYVGNPLSFDDSISYCSAGFGIVRDSEISNMLHYFDVNLPRLNTRVPSFLGGFSSFLLNSKLTNITFLGKFTVGNTNYFGPSNNINIGYIFGGQSQTSFLNIVDFVNKLS